MGEGEGEGERVVSEAVRGRAALEAPPDEPLDEPEARAQAGSAEPNAAKTDAPAPPAGEPPRLRRTAAFVSLTLSFGSGHFYARDALGGGLLLAAEVAALACALSGAPLVALAIPVIIACDLIGAQLVITRVRCGRPPIAYGRSMPALAIAALLLAPLLRATSPETLAAPAGVLVCEAAAHCGGEARMLCIEGLADRRMAGTLVSEALAACAFCIEPTHTCAGVGSCAAQCVETIALPVRSPSPGVHDDDDDFVRLLRDLPGADDDFIDRVRRGEPPREPPPTSPEPPPTGD